MFHDQRLHEKMFVKKLTDPNQGIKALMYKVTPQAHVDLEYSTAQPVRALG